MKTKQTFLLVRWFPWMSGLVIVGLLVSTGSARLQSGLGLSFVSANGLQLIEKRQNPDHTLIPFGSHPIKDADRASHFNQIGNMEYFWYLRQVYYSWKRALDPANFPPPPVTTFRAVSAGALAAEYPYQLGFAKFFKNDELFYYRTGGGGGARGFNVVALDPCTGEMIQAVQNFDTWGGGDEAMNALIAFLNGLPNGTLILIAVGDEAGLTQYPPNSCTPWPLSRVEAGYQALEALGSRKIRQYCYRDSWAMVTFKGTGQALEEQLGTAVQVTAQTGIVAPPVIAPTSQSFAASGGNGQLSVTAATSCGWSAVRNVSWLTITSGAGGSGNGTVNYSVSANNGAPRTGTLTIAGQTFTVDQAANCAVLTVNPATLPNGTVGTSYSQTMTASGGTPAYSFSLLSGTLPTGLNLATSGSLSGTPSATGTFSFTVKATDANGCTGMRVYSATINAANHPPTISAVAVTRQQGSPAANSVIVNISDADQAANTLTVTVNGSLSATVNGVTLSGLGISAAGVVTANVVASCAATNANFTLTVTDSMSASANATLNVTVTANSAPTFSYSNQSVTTGGSLTINPATGPSDNGTISSIVLQSQGAYSGTISVNNGTGLISLSGAKPGGTHIIMLRATDNCGTTTDVSFTLIVNCPVLTLSPATLSSGTAGTSYNQTISASSGAAPYSFTVMSGTLPPGLNLSISGLLSGTPTANGTFNFTVKATDANGCTGTQSYAVIINPANHAPMISVVAVTRQQGSLASNSTIAQVSDADQAANTLTVTINGGASATVNGVTASSISINAAGVVTASVIASCTATSANFTLTVIDSVAASVNATLGVAVTANSAPMLSYSNQSVSAGGATAISPATASDNGSITAYAIVSVIPALNSAPTVNSSGVVSISNAGPGGAHTITLRASDNCGATTDASFTLTVICPTITLSPLTLANGTVGTAYNQIVSASPAGGNYTFAINSGSLPAGLSINSATGAITGTPTAAGISNLSITATSFGTCAGSLAYSLTINAASSTIIVNSLNNTPIGDGQCTLTKALINANAAGQMTGGDCAAGAALTTITFSVTGTINLSLALPTIDSNVTITGPGPNLLTVRRNSGLEFRIFSINAGKTVSISGLTITNGKTAFGQDGGGIFNLGTLSLANCLISGNIASSFGGGVASLGSGALAITNCTISGNNAGPVGGGGGGIAHSNGPLVITNSTINGNAASNQGGGLNLFDTIATVTNSTISGNTAFGGGEGGGILVITSSGPAATLTLLNCTITGNIGSSNGGVISTSVSSDMMSAATRLKNTLVAANTGPNFAKFGTTATLTSLGNNLDSDGTSLFTNGLNADIVGTSSSPLNARLASLGNYGGLTQTHALLCNSPALNAGNNAGAPATDQRGVARPLGGTVDIGAFEANISLNPATLPAGVLGTSYNQAFTASGGNPGYSFGLLSGALPPGLALSATGLLSGTPTATGTFNFTLKATDAVGFAGACNYTLVINCPTLTVNPLTIPGATIGQPYSQTFMQTGGSGAITYSLTGALPPGLSFNAVAATLSGTPTQIGSSSVTVKATDANGCQGTQTYSLPVNCPGIAVSPLNLPHGRTGVPYNQTITAAGGAAPYAFTVSVGTLPPGLSLSTGGALSGTPVQAGTFNFSITATDAHNCGSARLYQLVIDVCPTINITPATLSAGTVGMGYAVTFTQTGGVGEITWSVSAGTLPSGVALNTTTGMLSGTPVQAGTFNFTIKASDANSCVGVRAYILPIDCPTISVNPASLPNGMAGTSYNQMLNAAGGAGLYSFALSAGNLPNGLTLSASGTLVGTPTVFGTFNFTVTATDASGCMAARAYALTLSPPCGTLTINPATIANSFSGSAYNQMLTAMGGTAPYAFTVSAGTLPGGLSLATSGLLSGTPAATGTFNFTIRATDANTCQGTRAYTVIVSGNALLFYPLAHPVRLLDTRPGQLGCDTPGAPLQGQVTRTENARVMCGGVTIPANAQAIAGIFTVVNGLNNFGYGTLYPAGVNAPNTANLNYTPQGVAFNSFTTGLDASGRFNIFTFSTVDVVIDVTGYFAPPGAGGLFYHTLPQPIRLLETRPGQQGCDTPGAPIQGQVPRTENARVTCGGVTVPQAAQAITGSFTVVNGLNNFGYGTLYPAGSNVPNTANLNYVPQGLAFNSFITGLNASGQFNIFTFSTVHAIIDVDGYFSPEAVDVNGRGLLYSPLLSPIRLLETRPGQQGCDTPGVPITSQVPRTENARITCGGATIPANAQAITGNFTVVNNLGNFGYGTLYPTGGNVPNTANLNYTPFGVAGNSFITGLNGGGQFNIFTFSTVHVIIDVAGYFAP